MLVDNIFRRGISMFFDGDDEAVAACRRPFATIPHGFNREKIGETMMRAAVEGMVVVATMTNRARVVVRRVIVGSR